MAGLGELFIELGVFADTKELEQAEKRLTEFVKTGQKAVNKVNENIKANDNFQNKLKDVVKGVGAVIGALTAAGYALNHLTNDLVQSNQAMLNLTRTSDISLSTFQKWGSIGKMLGVNNAAQQIEGLNQRLFELRLTGQGARGFQLAGINPTGDADSVMEQLRARVSGMSDTSASYLLREMGLDPQMLHLLRMGREEFEALGKTVKKYQLTDKQRADIQKMNIQLEIARQKLQYLKDRAILAIMPLFVDLAKSFASVTEMLMRWGKAIKNANVWWRGLITGLVYGLARIEKVRLFFKGISTALSECITKIPIFGKAFANLGRIFSRALLPLTALYLLLDDLAVYFEGGDSLIGRVLNWGKEKGAELGEGFKKLFGGDILDGFTQLAETGWGAIGDIIKILGRISDMLADFFSLGVWTQFKTNVKGAQYISPSPIVTLVNTPKILKNAKEGIEQLMTGSVSPSLQHKNAVSPTTENAINNNSVSNNSSSTTTLSMNNYFNTNQPAYDIERELRYVTAQFA